MTTEKETSPKLTEKSQKEEFRKIEISRILRFNVTLIIAVSIGAFTLNGYAFLEKYYLVLEVPIGRINISQQALLAYGGASLGSQMLAIIVPIALVATSTAFMALLEKPGKKPEAGKPGRLYHFIKRISDRAAELETALKIVTVAIIFATLGYAAWYGALEQPSGAGYESALKKVKTCSEQTIFFDASTEYTGCIVAESDDTLYLIKRLEHSDKEIKFKPYSVPKNGILRVEGSVKNYKFK